MVRFEKNKLVIEIESVGEEPFRDYLTLVHAVMEIGWYINEGHHNSSVTTAYSNLLSLLGMSLASMNEDQLDQLLKTLPR